MKQLKNQTVAHQWAHQFGQQGQGSNFFYQGQTIYSYGSHFPIATLHGDYVFVTLQKYSKTTAAHKNIVLSAVSHKQIVYVQFVPGRTDLSRPDTFLQMNFAYWLQEIESALQTLAQYPKRSSMLTRIKNCTEMIYSLAIAMNHQLAPSMLATLETPSLKGLKNYHGAEKKRDAERKRREQKKLSKLHAMFLSAWRAGTRGRTIDDPTDRNLAYLRYNPATGQIETSKGVEIPLPVAQACYIYIRRVLLGAQAVADYMILGFRIESISPAAVKVGCHLIQMQEIEAMAGLMGWKPQEN